MTVSAIIVSTGYKLRHLKFLREERVDGLFCGCTVKVTGTYVHK